MAIRYYLQRMVVDNKSDLSSIAPNAGTIAYCLDTPNIAFQWDGSNWNTSNKTQVLKSTVAVNGKTTGATLVYTLPASTLNFYPTQIIVRAVSISGVTTPPTVSVGTNSTSYNNIATGSLLNTVLNTVGATGGSPQNASTSFPIAGSTAIYANVTIGAIATNYTFYIEVIGFYDL